MMTRAPVVEVAEDSIAVPAEGNTAVLVVVPKCLTTGVAKLVGSAGGSGLGSGARLH